VARVFDAVSVDPYLNTIGDKSSCISKNEGEQIEVFDLYSPSIHLSIGKISLGCLYSKAV
jgi:hypothetical protein